MEYKIKVRSISAFYFFGYSDWIRDGYVICSGLVIVNFFIFFGKIKIKVFFFIFVWGVYIDVLCRIVVIIFVSMKGIEGGGFY